MLSRQTKWQLKNIAANRCNKCGGEKEPERSDVLMCKRCSDKNYSYYRRKMSSLNKCIYKDCPNKLATKIYCRYHADLYNKRQAELNRLRKVNGYYNYKID